MIKGFATDCFQVLVLCLLAIVAYAETHFEEDAPEDWAAEYLFPAKRSLRFPSMVQAKLFPAAKRPAFSEYPGWLYGDQ